MCTPTKVTRAITERPPIAAEHKRAWVNKHTRWAPLSEDEQLQWMISDMDEIGRTPFCLDWINELQQTLNE